MATTLTKQQKIQRAGANTSTFHVTINTNKQDDYYRDVLKAACNGFLENLETFFLKYSPSKDEMVSGNPAFGVWEPGEAPAEFMAALQGTEVVASLEKNPIGTGKNHGHHAHMAIRIKHTTRLQLDLVGMNSYFREQMQLAPHISVHAARGGDAFANFARYVKKDAVEVLRDDTQVAVLPVPSE
jgi:hypothetical protein